MAITAEIACKQGCGKTFTTEGWRVKHELKCKGKPALEGRIKLAMPEKGAQTPGRQRAPKRSRTRGHPDRTPPASQRARLIDARTQLLAELREKVDLLTAAIRGLEALG